MSERLGVETARRVVIKLGTQVVTGADGRIARDRIATLAEVVAGLAAHGRETLVVTSGAVGLGARALGLTTTPVDLEERQACAAVGQSRLVGVYADEFSGRGLTVGQVLLTQGDFDDRGRYLSLRGALLALLRRRVVPLINENDVVATEELAFVEGVDRPVFGDNDRLAALVAAKLGAGLLVLLTDVDGLYDRAPSEPGARRLDVVEDGRALLPSLAGPASRASRGGMRSKVESASLAARAGCHAIISSGLDLSPLAALLDGANVGTWFPAHGHLDSHHRWIAFAAASRGVLHLDRGAVAALRARGASLLAAGVARVEGAFRRGDVVALRGPDGELVGRGIVYCDHETARRWCAGAAPEGIRNHDALVHRNHLVLENPDV